MSTEFYSGMKGPVAISKLNALWDLASNVQGAPGTVVYRGTWDASSGSYPSSATLGDYYKINVSGTIATISYSVNDSIIYNGTSWDKIDNSEASVGVVAIDGGTIDGTVIGATEAAEGSFTDINITGTATGITATMVGLSNVNNTSDASKPVSTAQQTALDLKANLASPTFTGTIGGITAAMVGLSNVDNTSDASKPVSTAQAIVIGLKLDATHAASGGTAHPNATTTVSGFMSGADKTKLDGLSSGGGYTHPTDDGNLHVPATGTTNNGKVLTAGPTPGSLAWVTPSGGTSAITEVNVSAPLDSTGGVAPTISIDAAGASSDGYLTASDWMAFNGKQSALGFTPYSATNPSGFTSNEGTVTDVTGVGAISVVTGNTTPVISIAAATTLTPGTLSAVDKQKLDSIANSANNYVHPSSHPASIITQDASNRFVTDAEKATWNAKEAAVAAGTTAQYYRGDKSFQTLDKAAVGLGNVTNTADADKPVSTAQATAIGLKLDATHAGLGGTAHANAVAGGAAGFLSGADKTKLDGLVSNANHTGEVTGSTALTVTNAAVIGKVLTGYVSGAGTLAATDTILQAFNKLNGNVEAKGIGDVTLTGTQTLTNKTLTAPVLGTPTSGTLTNCTADGTNAVGFKTIPQNSKSAAYTLVLADSGTHILHPSVDTTARTFTIPANASVAYPIGTAITFVNQASAGVVTIAITTDTMRLAGAGTTGSRTLAANGVATAIKLTATEWIISGTGLT